MKPFNRNDEQFLEAFVIFCGLGIQNTQLYEAVERAMAKQMVTLEVSTAGRPLLSTADRQVTFPLTTRQSALSPALTGSWAPRGQVLLSSFKQLGKQTLIF